MSSEVPVAVLQAPGINCDNETTFAFELAGAKPTKVHISELRDGSRHLRDFKQLALSGGFSFGDDLGAGVVLGNEIVTQLADQVGEFVDRGGLVLGVCNGFQVLVATGLLPFGEVQVDFSKRKAALADNDKGYFRSDWVRLSVEDSSCRFLQGMEGQILLPVAHGEGKFVVAGRALEQIEAEKLVVFRYVDRLGDPTLEYPQNPNGSINAIAGVTDPTGRILGLMPHPERFIFKHQYDNFRREKIYTPHGLPIFQRMVAYSAQS